MGLPIKETVYQGIGTTNQVSSTDFYYDDTTNCATASANPAPTPNPTKGNLTGISRWLSGSTNPVVRMSYDNYGNLTCTRDPKGNTSTITYDTTGIFPKISTGPAPFYFATTTQYYGVDSVSRQGVLYGQVKSVTDPNGAVTTSEYDVFGRVTKIIGPIQCECNVRH